MGLNFTGLLFNIHGFKVTDSTNLGWGKHWRQNPWIGRITYYYIETFKCRSGMYLLLKLKLFKS